MLGFCVTHKNEGAVVVDRGADSSQAPGLLHVRRGPIVVITSKKAGQRGRCEMRVKFGVDVQPIDITGLA